MIIIEARHPIESNNLAVTDKIDLLVHFGKIGGRITLKQNESVLGSQVMPRVDPTWPILTGIKSKLFPGSSEDNYS